MGRGREVQEQRAEAYRRDEGDVQDELRGTSAVKVGSVRPSAADLVVDAALDECVLVQPLVPDLDHFRPALGLDEVDAHDTVALSAMSRVALVSNVLDVLVPVYPAPEVGVAALAGRHALEDFCSDVVVEVVYCEVVCAAHGRCGWFTTTIRHGNARSGRSVIVEGVNKVAGSILTRHLFPAGGDQRHVRPSKSIHPNTSLIPHPPLDSDRAHVKWWVVLSHTLGNQH